MDAEQIAEFDLGMVEDRIAVRPNPDLGAVEIWVLDADVALLLSPTSAVDVVMKVVAALIRLNREASHG
jgi:hypothetical protein